MEVEDHIKAIENAKKHAEEAKERAEQAKYDAQKQRERAEIEKTHAQMAMSLAEKARKIAEIQKKKADTANEAKTKFITALSHEIESPLKLIEELIKNIRTDSKEPKTLEYAEKIMKKVELLQQIIDDVLDLSDMESDQSKIHPVHFNLRRMIEAVNEEAAALAKENGIHYEFVVDESVPQTVFADEAKIKRILLNILYNAINYTSEGMITFEAKADERKLMFKINDSGAGIKESNLPLVFDAFREFDKEKNQHIAGTGLSLSIAKHLCGRMKGNISVTSTYGIGSTFRVKLPFQKSDS